MLLFNYYTSLQPYIFYNYYVCIIILNEYIMQKAKILSNLSKLFINFPVVVYFNVLHLV